MMTFALAAWILLASLLAAAAGLFLMSGPVESRTNLLGRLLLTSATVTAWAVFMALNIFTPSFDFALTVVLLFLAGLFHTSELMPERPSRPFVRAGCMGAAALLMVSLTGCSNPTSPLASTGHRMEPGSGISGSCAISVVGCPVPMVTIHP